ncbi:MAG: hypothetical protein J5666_04525 [Bacilli bacterium]|nr:hypothetical protein [Bacilli bacterium]
MLEYEQKEITYMANEERETKQTLMNIVLIMSIVICSAFIIFYFLPLFQVYEYDYSHGTPPDRVMGMMSSFSILVKHNIPFGHIALGLSVVEVVLATLCLKIFNKSKVVVRYITYVLFILCVFVIFMTIAFSCGFSG